MKRDRVGWWLVVLLTGWTHAALPAQDGSGAVFNCTGALLNPDNAHFQRDGNAYLAGPDGMHTYFTNEMRRKTELSCSAGQVEILTNELGEGEGDYAVPWCVTGPEGVTPPGLWAKKGWTYQVWRNDGTSWIHMSNLPMNGDGRYSFFVSLFALGNGRLLAFDEIGGDSPPPPRIWHGYYSDDGINWTEASFGSGTLQGAPYFIHNLYEAHGVIVAVTYALPENTSHGLNVPKQIWRSTNNGATWVLAWEGGAGQFDHFHSVVYHKGTGRWIVDTGDADDAYHPHDLTHDRTFTSTDDGETWHEWWTEFMPPGLPNHVSPTGQVTCFRATGDPNRVILGSDSNQRVGWFDLTTWRTGTFMDRQFSNRGPQSYVWDLSKFGDVWYATLASSVGGQQTPVVLASADLGRWAVCGRLAPEENTYQTFGYCAGRLGDWLHYIVANEQWEVRHARARVVSVAEVNGVCVSPAKMNLLTADESTCHDPDLWLVDGSTHPDADSTVQFFDGSPSLHVLKTGMDSNDVVTIQLLSEEHDANANTPYRFHAWVRGYAKTLHLEIQNAYCEPGFSLRADPNGNPLWTEIWTPAISYDHQFQLRPRIRISPNEVDRKAELWLGAAEVEEVPVEGEWVPGGATSPIERFDYEGLSFGTEWTHLFSTVLLSGTDDLGSTGRSYIRSYRMFPPPIAGPYAELYFDCADKCFKLAVNGATVLTSAPRALLGGTRCISPCGSPKMGCTCRFPTATASNTWLAASPANL
jgi:hypothetical protein